MCVRGRRPAVAAPALLLLLAGAAGFPAAPSLDADTTAPPGALSGAASGAGGSVVPQGNSTTGDRAPPAGFPSELVASLWRPLSHDSPALRILGCVVLLVVVLATKPLWYRYVRVNCHGEWHCPSLRNNICCGRLLSFCCPCDEYHPPFRLRIVVHEGKELRGRVLYVAASCGNNPPKTTSAQKVPFSGSRFPVVWNEPLDVDVNVADQRIFLQAVELQDSFVHGVITLETSEFFPMLQGSLDEVMYLPETCMTMPFLNGAEPEGELTFSLYATHYGQPLPEVIHDYTESE